MGGGGRVSLYSFSVQESTGHRILWFTMNSGHLFYPWQIVRELCVYLLRDPSLPCSVFRLFCLSFYKKTEWNHGMNSRALKGQFGILGSLHLQLSAPYYHFEIGILGSHPLWNWDLGIPGPPLSGPYKLNSPLPCGPVLSIAQWNKCNWIACFDLMSNREWLIDSSVHWQGKFLWSICVIYLGGLSDWQSFVCWWLTDQHSRGCLLCHNKELRAHLAANHHNFCEFSLARSCWSILPAVVVVELGSSCFIHSATGNFV